MSDATHLARVTFNWDPDGIKGPYDRDDGDYYLEDDRIDLRDLAEAGVNYDPIAVNNYVPGVVEPDNGRVRPLPVDMGRVPTIHYFATVDGQPAGSLSDLQPGDHELGIWVQVTGNDLGEDLGQGGVLQSVFNVRESSNGLRLHHRCCSFPAGVEIWDAGPAEPALTSALTGVAISAQSGEPIFAGADAYGVAAAVNPTQVQTHAQRFGADGLSLFVTGNFEWNGEPTTVSIEPGPLLGHLVYGDRGSELGATYPAAVIGTSFTLGTLLVPEPCSGLLAAVALVGATVRRKSPGDSRCACDGAIRAYQSN